MLVDTSPKWDKEATLVKKVKVSHNSTIFTFKFKENFELDLLPGQHITFIATIDGTTVMRPYTPIECRPKECEFDTLIKIYPDGLMSQHVESLETGASLSIRGVSSDVTYSPNTICIPGFHENI